MDHGTSHVSVGGLSAQHKVHLKEWLPSWQAPKDPTKSPKAALLNKNKGSCSFEFRDGEHVWSGSGLDLHIITC